MITKTGLLHLDPLDYLVIASSAGIGYHNSHKLTDQQASDLRRVYELDPDANLTLRSIGRGLAGCAAGAVLGLIPGFFATGIHPYVGRAAILGSGLLGAHLASQKYSPSEAERLRGCFDDRKDD